MSKTPTPLKWTEIHLHIISNPKLIYGRIHNQEKSVAVITENHSISMIFYERRLSWQS
jgi:hypothetical protein